MVACVPRGWQSASAYILPGAKGGSDPLCGPFLPEASSRRPTHIGGWCRQVFVASTSAHYLTPCRYGKVDGPITYHPMCPFRFTDVRSEERTVHLDSIFISHSGQEISGYKNKYGHREAVAEFTGAFVRYWVPRLSGRSART